MSERWRVMAALGGPLVPAFLVISGRDQGIPRTLGFVRVFHYPDGGDYFGVPLANFAGWVVVGWVIAGGYDLLSRRGTRGWPRGGVGLYYVALALALGLTVWIGEFVLAGTGILLHSVVFLVLWTGLAGARARSARTTFTYERIS